MTPEVREEVQEPRQYGGLEYEAQLNIFRTNNLLEASFEQLLKPYGVTGTQYNVLRMLGGAGSEGFSRNEVREGLLTRMPDTTRLLDRMERAGLVTRSRDSADRRLVKTRLTERGHRLLYDLDDVVVQEYQRNVGHLSKKQLRRLIKLLKLVRNPSQDRE